MRLLKLNVFKNLVAILIVTSIFISTVPEVNAQSCCNDSTPRGVGLWQDVINKPFQGRCIGQKCYECKTQNTNCEFGIPGQCYNPSNLPQECGTGICDETVNACIPRPPVPGQTVPCAGGTCVSTAIGDLPSDNYGRLITQIIQVGIGIGSGVAFLMIIMGTYKIMSSQGSPDAINAGKDQLTSAIIGLIFIILSVTVMQIIGFDILGLGPLGLGTI